MGILPLEFKAGQSSESLGLTGKEQFSIELDPERVSVNQIVTVKTNTGKSFQAKLRLDTDVELEYYKNGGILNYALRKIL
jgi:aconitate hydratase